MKARNLIIIILLLGMFMLLCSIGYYLKRPAKDKYIELEVESARIMRTPDGKYVLKVLTTSEGVKTYNLNVTYTLADTDDKPEASND